MTRSPVRHLFVFLLPFIVAACHPVVMAPSPSSESTMGRFQGQMLWDKTPIGKAAIFLRPLSQTGDEIEFRTRTDGRFDLPLAPGRYNLRSSPTTMCPVKGTIEITQGVNRYRLFVHPVSFLSCTPGKIEKQ